MSAKMAARRPNNTSAIIMSTKRRMGTTRTPRAGWGSASASSIFNVFGGKWIGT